MNYTIFFFSISLDISVNLFAPGRYFFHPIILHEIIFQENYVAMYVT